MLHHVQVLFLNLADCSFKDVQQNEELRRGWIQCLTESRPEQPMLFNYDSAANESAMDRNGWAKKHLYNLTMDSNKPCHGRKLPES